MSTRSMVLVHQPYDGNGKAIPLYRHCDGYPAESGAALLEATKNALCAEDVLAKLLAMRYDHGHYPEPIYRAATWQPEDQGDLEYVYVVEPSATKSVGGVRPAVLEWTITVHDRRGNWDQENYRDWTTQPCGRVMFADMVNRERREMNARMKSQGFAGEPYEMVTA